MGKPSVLIRESITSDLPRIAEFDLLSQKYPQRLEHIRKSIESGQAWSILVKENVIGYLIINYSFYHRCILDLLYVAEPMRGKGIGRKAIQWVKQYCTESFFTSTNLSNSTMLHLLRTEGFQDSGIIHNLDEGDSEVVFYYSNVNRPVND